MNTTLTIQNLKCGGCANTIINKLSALKNISNVEVNVDTSEVSFEHSSNEEIILVNDKLASLGYPVEGDKNSVVSKAKSFVSCAVGKMG